MTEKVDLIVVGAGPGGYEVAAKEAAKGKSVVIVEKDLPGGTCLNRGCIPTKCLCAGAGLIHNLSRASEFGVEISDFKIDYAAAAERATKVVAELRGGVEVLLSKCRFVAGEARITPDGNVEVGDEILSSQKIIIATGSKPALLPIPGAELAMTSDDFLKLVKLPERLVIIGAGVIGLEFAYIASSYGVSVTVLEYCKEILPPFDAEVAKRLRLILSSQGINFVTSASVTAINKDGNNYIVAYADKKGEKTAEGDAVLMAVGRRAVLPEGLKEAGIEVNARGFIVTNDSMETTRPGIYAVGDCNGKMMLAHAASAQSMYVIGEDINLNVIPSAVFTSPELAMVGLTTEQCKANGLDYVSSKAFYRANGKALASGHYDGFVKVLYDPITRKMLGCHILGEGAANLIQEATDVMANGLTIDAITRSVHGHPTLSEIVASALS